MANIQRRETSDGKTKYRVQVRLRGFPPETKTFDRITDAKEWAQHVETKLREGSWKSQAEARRHTFAELADAYVAHQKALGTFDPQRAHQVKFWRDRLGEFLLSRVTVGKIAGLRDALATGDTPSGEPASVGTVNRYLSALSNCLKYGVELEWLEENPVRRVKRPREPQGRVRFLEDDERARLLTACRESSDLRLYPLVVLALSTGARRGELLGLRWQDIDLEKRQATLHKTKNRERRALVLTGPAFAAIAELRQRRVVGVPWIFADRRGRRNFNEYAWREALAAARIEDFRFHDLRHSAASYLAMSGASAVEIRDALGHKTLAMTNRYAHLRESHVADVMGRMVDKFIATDTAATSQATRARE